MRTRYVCAVLVLAGIAVPGAVPRGQAPNQASLVTQTVAGVKFSTLPGFAIERMNPPDKGDSYVVITFDSLGRLVVSKEQDFPRILLDNDKDGIYESEKVISDKVRNCQGLWFEGRTLYAACAMVPTPEQIAAAPPPAPGGGRGGPNINNRAGIFRLEDTNGDDVADTFETLGDGRLDSGAWPACDSPPSRRRHLRHRRQQRDDCRPRARPDVAGAQGQGRAVPALLRQLRPERARRRAQRHLRLEPGERRSSACSRAAIATPTTTATTSPAKRSSSTATWSGTSACRGIAKCARRTRSSTATTATRTARASTRRTTSTRCRRCATSGADRRSASSSTRATRIRGSSSTTSSRPTGRAAACSTRR